MLDNILLEVNPPKGELEIAVFKEDDQFIAYVPSLDVAGHGSTREEAIENLKEVVTITIEWAKENKTIIDLLLSNGWTLKLYPKPIYRPPFFSIRSIRSKFNIKSIERNTLELAR